MKRSHTTESLKAIALKFQTRTALKRGDYGAYATMRARGLLDECCAHMAEDKRGYDPIYTDEEIASAFKKYTTLNGIKHGPHGNFYKIALHRYGHGSAKWREITAHMTPPVIFTGHEIYVFEFADRSAYVGQTRRKDRRFDDHEKTGPVKQHIDANPGITYELKILEAGLLSDAVKEREAFWQQKYLDDGWKPLWDTTRPAGGQGGFSLLTKAACAEAAAQCKTRNEFWVRFQARAKRAKKMGWYDEITAHMLATVPVSEETRRKQSESAKKRVRTEEQEAARIRAAAEAIRAKAALKVLPELSVEDNVSRELRKRGYKRTRLVFCVTGIAASDLEKQVAEGPVRFRSAVFSDFVSDVFTSPTWFDACEAAEKALIYARDHHHVYLADVRFAEEKEGTKIYDLLFDS